MPILSSKSFPEATPLHAFFAWNEARRRKDRRYVVARDLHGLLERLGGGAAARDACAAHLALRPVILWRWRGRMILSRRRALDGVAALNSAENQEAVRAARAVVTALLASIGAAKIEAHAAVFRALEALAEHVSLSAYARMRPRHEPRPPRPHPRRILVIKLSALGDFILALGPAAALRRHHEADRITLLTTRPYAEFARQTRLFDEVLIDDRPKGLRLGAWLALRRALGTPGFERVYDLQTSGRSSRYAWVVARRVEWSGISFGCSHPHANLGRDPQHTIDKQAEQLLMAGIYPVPLPALPRVPHLVRPEIEGRPFVLLIPGSAPRHPRKRWPAAAFGELACRLLQLGLLPVVIGASGEEELGHAIGAECPGAVDVVGRTDLAAVADLAQRAALTVGNDTGPLHMAAAGGHPVLALFSDLTEPSRCAPRGGVVRVIAAGDLGTLGVSRVFDEALALWRAHGQIARPRAASLEGSRAVPP